MAEIEYFYAAYSAYAYLGNRRFQQIARDAGRTIAHRPIDLRRVVAEVSKSPFGNRSDGHKAYFFGREIQRWSEERNAPVIGHTPTHHGNDITLSNCFLIAGLEAGLNIDELSHRLMESHWAEDSDLDDAPTLARLAREVGVDPDPLLQGALTPEIQGIYQRWTQEAIDRSVFGSPTYFVDGDMFYGQDRLELVERALKQPYKR